MHAFLVLAEEFLQPFDLNHVSFLRHFVLPSEAAASRDAAATGQDCESSCYSAMPIFAPSFRAVNAMVTSKSTINTPSAQT